MSIVFDDSTHDLIERHKLALDTPAARAASLRFLRQLYSATRSREAYRACAQVQFLREGANDTPPPPEVHTEGLSSAHAGEGLYRCAFGRR